MYSIFHPTLHQSNSDRPGLHQSALHRLCPPSPLLILTCIRPQPSSPPAHIPLPAQICTNPLTHPERQQPPNTHNQSLHLHTFPRQPNFAPTQHHPQPPSPSTASNLHCVKPSRFTSARHCSVNIRRASAVPPPPGLRKTSGATFLASVSPAGCCMWRPGECGPRGKILAAGVTFVST